jgi:hypothetical protein
MSLDRNAEVQRLGEADRHIALSERVITEQTIEVERLRHGHHDTARAEKMLRSFELNLQTIQEHRRLIIEMIEQIDAGPA